MNAPIIRSITPSASGAADSDLLERARGQVRSRSAIENLLHLVDFGAEMELMFQPIVDPMSERTAGSRSLARWNCSRLGWFRRPTSSGASASA